MPKKPNTETKIADQEVKRRKFKSMMKETGIIIGAFLVLNSFVLASFVVPTGSMENEIMAGDFLLVNKFVFGGTTPTTIPFTSVRVPSFKLPTFWEVERGDVIVFMFPGYRDEVEPAEFAYYLKRCIGLPGDTIAVIDRVVYVNGSPAPIPRNMKFNNSFTKPAGMPDPKIFPPGTPYNEDNYGPIVVPKKGDVLQLTSENFIKWEIFIRREGHSAELIDGKVYIDGAQAKSYTVERDYVFGMGDNRDNSLDSRFWGFIPKNFVVGTPVIVYWSWDPDIPLFTTIDLTTSFRIPFIAFWNLPRKLSTIHWNRLGSIVG